MKKLLCIAAYAALTTALYSADQSSYTHGDKPAAGGASSINVITPIDDTKTTSSKPKKKKDKLNALMTKLTLTPKQALALSEGLKAQKELHYLPTA